MNRHSAILCSFILALFLGDLSAQPLLQKGMPASAQVSADRLTRIDRAIQQAIDQSEIAGATALIARNGKIVYEKAFGMADVQTKEPMQVDHIFRIASQTKAITSVAVMQLFEEGKFLLDDPISTFIPAFKNPKVLVSYNAKDTTYTTRPAKREITIRDLLTHTSGLQYAVIGSDQWKAIYAKASIPAGFEASKDSVRWAIDRLAQFPLSHDPGEKFSYGMSTDVLGRLIEVASGMSLDQYFRERIFKPLGMKDTYFYLPANKQQRLVSVHTNDMNKNLVVYKGNKGVTTAYPLQPGVYYSGGAGLSATIDDYAIFLQMLLNKGVYGGKRLLSRRSVELMTCNQIGDLSVSDNDKFGLGFQVVGKQGQAILGMTEGSFKWGGYFATTYWVDPKEKIVALIFAQQSGLHSNIHDKFRALVYQALND